MSVQDVLSWTLAEWAAFDALRERLVHQRLDAHTLYWLDTRSAPAAADERDLQLLLSQSDTSPDALLASSGWDLLALQPNPLYAWGREQPEWLNWANDFLQRQGITLDLRSWVLPLERSVAGLALACTPAIWYEWLQLALQLRAEHQQGLDRDLSLWQVGEHTLTAAQMLYPWLMNIVLAHRSSRVMALNPFARPAMLEQARMLMPIAVQAAALKSSYQQTGDSHYLHAFEQIGQHQSLKDQGLRFSKPMPAAAHQTSA